MTEESTTQDWVPSTPFDWVPSTPFNQRGDRLLVRGKLEGIARMVEAARATGRAQGEERVRTFLEQAVPDFDLITDAQLEAIVRVVMALTNETTRKYTDRVVATLADALKRIPTAQFIPDPRESPVTLDLPGSEPREDPLVQDPNCTP